MWTYPLRVTVQAISCKKLETKNPETRLFLTCPAQLGEFLTVRGLSVWGPYVLCLPDSEAQCRTALTDWLLRYGEQTYYDRLSRALQHIGRTDIAIGEKQVQTERTHVPPIALNNLFKQNNSGANNVMDFKLKQFVRTIMSWRNNRSTDKRKSETKPHLGTWRCVSKKLVYFGQEGLLKTLTTVSNCFITLRSILIGTSSVAHSARCQSLACVAVQCTHSSTAEWRWIGGGVNDLTEDSVELTPATEQTICSFHQQLWSKKKKKQNKERMGWEDEL